MRPFGKSLRPFNLKMTTALPLEAIHKHDAVGTGRTSLASDYRTPLAGRVKAKLAALVASPALTRARYVRVGDYGERMQENTWDAGSRTSDGENSPA
jgi:hypothetical protein